MNTLKNIPEDDRANVVQNSQVLFEGEDDPYTRSEILTQINKIPEKERADTTSFAMELAKECPIPGIKIAAISMAAIAKRPEQFRTAFKNLVLNRQQELSIHDIKFEIQKPLPVVYKGVHLDCGYRIDILIEKQLIIELKVVDKLLPVHEAQILTYMKLADISVGLLINFNEKLLKN